jgi:hypothetical protein
MGSFQEFIAWYEANAEHLPNLSLEDKTVKISASYALMALKAGYPEKLLGFKTGWVMMAGAYDFGKQNAAIQSAPFFKTPKEVIAWYETQTAADLPNSLVKGEKISLTYLTSVLDVLSPRKISGTREEFGRYLGAYEYGQNPRVKSFIDHFESFGTVQEFMGIYLSLDARSLPRMDQADQKISAGGY